MLTPFEEYLLGDNTPAYPINCFVRLCFSGSDIERETLEAVFHKTLSLHPMLHSRVEERKGRFHWLPLPESNWPRILWTEARPNENRKMPRGRAFDLSREAGIRLHVRTFPGNRCDWVVEFHHALTDGLGIYAFLRELLEAYQLAVGGRLVDSDSQSGPERRPDAQGRENRGRAPRSLRTPFFQIPSIFYGIARAFRFIWFRPGQLLPFAPERPIDRNAPDSHPLYPGIVVRTIDREKTANMRATAKRQGATLNDWLLASFGHAVYLYRREIGAEKAKRCLRFAVPVSLRDKAGEVPAAANQVGIVFLDRHIRDLADKKRLLRGIHTEMRRLLRTQSGKMMHALLAISRYWGGDLRWTARKRCWASTVVSNLGEPFARLRLPRDDDRFLLGNQSAETDLRLERVFPTPPLRPGVAAVLGVQTYAGRFMLALHYDTCSFTPEECGRLLDLCVEQLLHH